METGHSLQETELIQGLVKGQDWAFERLVALHKDRMYNTALGFLQNETDAEDVTQEVFIKVYQSIAGFKGEAALSTWLYRIVVTQSLDFLRRKKRQNKGGFFQNIFGKETGEPPDFYHPGVVAEQKETAAILFKAIRQLPEQQQTAFLLQKTENLSQTEIAEVMSTSVGAVESLLQRAKSNLRKQLEDYYLKQLR